MGIWCYTKLETTGNPKAKNFQQLWHRLNIYSNRAYFRQLKKFSMVTKFGDFIEHWSIVALKFFKLNFCNRIVHIVPAPCDKKFSGLPKFQSQQVRDLRNQEKKWSNYRIQGHSDSGPPCRKAFQKIINIFLHPKDVNESMNSFANFQIGCCCDTCQKSSIFTGEIIAD